MFERIQVWPSVLPQATGHYADMGDHAGFYETSLILAAHPELVDQTKLDVAAPWYTHAATSNALDASVKAGERLWNAMVDAWIEKLAFLE